MSARMRGTAVRTAAIVGLAIAAFIAVPGIARAQVANAQVDDSQTLNYSRGQGIMPLYDGWHPNPDGTIDLWFGYLNENWREETDIPVGPNNSVTGPSVLNTPDGSQPTHFFPRNNRWQFLVRIPNAQALAKDEVVWTVTSHGRTYKAYATLKSQYVRDDEGIMREFFGETPESGNEAPKLSIAGDLTRTIKVGQPNELTVVATDDGKPVVSRGRGTAAAGAAAGGSRNGLGRGNICGATPDQFFCGAPNEGGGQLFQIRGFRMSCFLYRGDPAIKISSREDFGQATLIAFDPPQEKVWEDPRGGSPFASGYQLPPIPKDNTWHINTTFSKPGTFVVRCQAHDGLLVTNQNVTFKVIE
jgi:hypothetical protein